MKNISLLDKVASSVILLGTLLVGVVIFLGQQAGIRVKIALPENSLVGPYQTIKLTFSEAVDSKLVEPLVEIQPSVDGKFQWPDSQTLQFQPSTPLKLGTVYKLTLHTGTLSQSGHKLKTDHSWEMQVREPLIAYINTQSDQAGIWTVGINTNSSHQLTDSSVKVMGFDTSRDGEFIVFYAMNKQGGIDLWRVTRDGVASVLLDCGLDRCTTPSISPDGTQIAYSREAAGPSADLPYGSPRVWILDIANGKDGPVYQDQQVLGYEPEWSPDGTELASYDGIADQIRLINIKSGELFIFSSGTGGPITWSPDSKKFLFTDVEQSEGGIRTRVRMADLELNKTYTLIGEEDDMDYGYYSLIWSPTDSTQVLLGMRAGGDEPSQVLWLFNPGLLDGIMIADQPNYAYNSPQWDVWGDALIFQQFKLKDTYKPEIGFWKQDFQQPQVIAEGLMPHWLP
ncbi:MAG: Ig-like domain-containing protein [Anaerolineales bacterium]